MGLFNETVLRRFNQKVKLLMLFSCLQLRGSEIKSRGCQGSTAIGSLQAAGNTALM